MTTALITGVSGQDGAYLAQLLLDKDYRVYGAYRRTSSVNFWRMDELGVSGRPNLELVEYDLTDPGCSLRLIGVLHRSTKMRAGDELRRLQRELRPGRAGNCRICRRQTRALRLSVNLPSD